MTAPTARTLSYNSLAQELVEGGYTEDGTLYYALGDETEATEAYDTSVPTGTEVGNYYVWYKVVGDNNHSDTEPACIPVEITRPHTPSTPTTETVTIPVTGDEARTEVTVSVSGDTATITSADIDDVLSEDKKTGTVTIDVSSLRENITEVVLPAEMVNKLADAVADPKDDADGVEIKLPAGTVTFDKAAVAAIAKQADGKDLHLNLEGIPQSRLDAGQQAAIRDMTVCKVLDVYMTANSKRISDFQGGTATVEVGFALQDGQKAKGIVVWYVDETGEKTEIANSYDGKAVCFAVTHFSNYVIAYDEARAALPDGDYEALTDEEKAQADAIAAALGTDANTAAQMLRYAQEKGIPLETVLLGDAAIKGLPTSDEDPTGSSFGKLTARATKRAKTAITVTWKKVDDADGYLIYGNQCGKTNKLLKTIPQKDTIKWTQKKLKKGKFYKYMVVAYKSFGEAKMPIAASVYVHTATKGAKKTVAKKVKVNKTSVTLGIGETVKLKASEVKAEKKKLSKHRAIRYEVEAPNIVTVAADGTITAVGEGSTTIYVYAQNGLYRIVTVTVSATPPAAPNSAEEANTAEETIAEDALTIDLTEPETDETLVEIDDSTVEDNDTSQIEMEIILEDEATYID